MKEQEIPRERWPEFCAGFSREHHGWIASLGVIDTMRLRRGHRTAARALIRDGVFRQLRLDSADGDLTVEVGSGAATESHSAHGPRRVFLEREDDGAHRGLRVDDSDGCSLLIEFRAAALPEALDGLADSERE